MYKYHLHDVNWGAFFLSDICNINSGIRLTKANMKDGPIPFIGATDSNNGITNFISNTNASFEKNVLGVNYNGSVVENFYHPYSCVFSDDVKKVSFKDEQGQNKHCYMFLKQMILQQKAKYRYAYKFNGDRMARQKIMLPLDETDNPNWHFMEEYIKERENKQRQDLKEYYKNRLLDLVICPEVLTDVAWGEFLIKNIFTIEAVKGKPVKNYTRGTTPYVTTSSLNNGVTHFICANNKISKGKCISIDPIGGKTFYHEYEFIGRGGAGSAINLLYNKNLNKQIALFLCNAIEKTSLEKASYAIALNGDRLRNAKILLPIDENGNPNWLYMENFIKKIEQNQIKNILKHLNGYIYIYSGQ